MILKLTQDYTTQVDDDLPEELRWVLDVKWYAHYSRTGVYARNRKHGFLHRVLMKTPRHLQVDHVNGDPLDNRLENLRNVMQKTNIRHMYQLKEQLSDEPLDGELEPPPFLEE